MAQAAGGSSPSANCVPQVAQMKFDKFPPSVRLVYSNESGSTVWKGRCRQRRVSDGRMKKRRLGHGKSSETGAGKRRWRLLRGLDLHRLRCLSADRTFGLR